MDSSIRKRILIVDDILHWRKLLQSLLEGYEVVVVATYREALSAIDQCAFDIAVLDIRLEDENIWNVDGLDLLKKIRTNNPNTGIIILTGYRGSARDQILREYSPDEIIDKQAFDNVSFRDAIQRIAYQSKPSKNLD